MSDWLVIRIPLDDPNDAEVVESLSNVPLDWKEHLEKTAQKIGKPGRYVAADILYDVGDAFYPKVKQEQYKETEKESGD